MAKKPSAFVKQLRERLIADKQWRVSRGNRVLEAIHLNANEVVNAKGFKAQLWVDPKDGRKIRCAFEIVGNKEEEKQRRDFAKDIRDFIEQNGSIGGAQPSKHSTVARLKLVIDDSTADANEFGEAIESVVKCCADLDRLLSKWAEQKRPVGQQSQPRQFDPQRSSDVEKAAISETTAYFIGLPEPYSVESKEKDYLGWDLLATRDEEQLHLEVKGLFGKRICVELTPNEYEKMKELSDSYRVCIVTSALQNPQLHRFSYRPTTRMLHDDDDENRTLQVEERIAARCHGKAEIERPIDASRPRSLPPSGPLAV